MTGRRKKMKEMNIYHCDICGNTICMIKDSGVVPECCGVSMKKIQTNTQDGGGEKHVPVVSEEEGTVNVSIGAAEHPSTDIHYIQWIAVLTDKGIYVKKLCPGDSPKGCFRDCTGESILAVYDYCNIHGLWVWRP